MPLCLTEWQTYRRRGGRNPSRAGRSTPPPASVREQGFNGIQRSAQTRRIDAPGQEMNRFLSPQRMRDERGNGIIITPIDAEIGEPTRQAERAERTMQMQ